MTVTRRRATGTPPARAASGDRPSARTSKPQRVRKTIAVTSPAAMRPRGSATLAALPPTPRPGRRAPSTRCGVCTVPRSKTPPAPIQLTIATTMKLSIMVEMTSCAPR
jgi:hypothetical protein